MMKSVNVQNPDIDEVVSQSKRAVETIIPIVAGEQQKDLHQLQKEHPSRPHKCHHSRYIDWPRFFRRFTHFDLSIILYFSVQFTKYFPNSLGHREFVV